MESKYSNTPFTLTLFRLHELVASGDGIGIVEQGLAFGGGALQEFGINSNTSANGFIRGIYKAKETI